MRGENRLHIGEISATRRQFARGTLTFGTASILSRSSERVAATNDGTKQLWRFETDDWVLSSPTIVGGSVYVGSDDLTVYSIDAETGQKRWQFRADGEITSSPTVVDGTVVIGGKFSNVYALSAETGDEYWRFGTGGAVLSSPAVADETVFVGSTDSKGHVYAIDLETGQLRWQTKTQDQSWTPIVVDGNVYVGSMEWHGEGIFYSLDAESGDVQWQQTIGGWRLPAPIVSESTVYVTNDKEGELYALDNSSGTVQWKISVGSEPTAPTMFGETIFVGDADSHLYAFDATTGEEMWRYETGGEVNSSPTVAGDTVFFGSDDNNVYALDRETGSLHWSFKTGGRVTSSPTVVDGIVFVGSWDGSVYALDAGVSGSSEDSRINQGAYGHHHSFIGNRPQQINVETDSVETSGPGFGIAAGLFGIGAGGLLVNRYTNSR